MNKPLLLLLLLTLTACGVGERQPAQRAEAASPASAGAAASADAAAQSATLTPPPATPPPPTLTAAPTAAATPALTAAPSPASSDSPAAGIPAAASTPLPEEHYIRPISGHKQYFSLGCEAAAAKDWANFFGYDFNEFEFQYKLPLSDNPDKGFVGDVNAPWGQVPPYGYGVHAGPVADLLTAYGIPARAYHAYTLEQVRQKLALDKPVIAWVIGNMVGGVPYEYTDKAGDKVTVAAYEHVVILTGYGPGKIRYMNNGKFFEAPEAVFLNSWGVLGSQVIVDE